MFVLIPSPKNIHSFSGDQELSLNREVDGEYFIFKYFSGRKQITVSPGVIGDFMVEFFSFKSRVCPRYFLKNMESFIITENP